MAIRCLLGRHDRRPDDWPRMTWTCRRCASRWHHVTLHGVFDAARYQWSRAD